jgi:hypothetical protein
VVRVTAGGLGRVSAAGMVCYRPGERSRLIYRLHVYHKRKSETASFTERDYMRLIDAAHHQLGVPIVLVWDNLNRHTSAAMRKMTTQREWLTLFQLPSYAPELNPQEGVWANLRLGLVNLKPLLGGIDDLATLVKAALKRMQYRTDGLIDGFLAETKLTFDQT